MSLLRLIIRPSLFTVGVCGTCFCSAAILQHENGKRAFPLSQDWISIQKQRDLVSKKYIGFRQKINRWANQLSTGQKIACGTIFANLVVLCAWRVPQLQPVLTKFFLCRISTPKIPLSPMILSCFSHSMPLHFAFNMYALYSFAPFANSLLGPEQLIGLFISAGAVSSLASISHKILTKSTMPSLGASGALLGVIAYICVVRPDAELLLLFVPIAAGTAIKGIMAMDLVGVVARWKYLDHAAHLGGSLFGVWYATHGEKLFYKHRKTVVDTWMRLKSKYD